MRKLLFSRHVAADKIVASDLTCVGPPDREHLEDLRIRSAQRRLDVCGAVLDVRGGLDGDDIHALFEVRQPLLDWITNAFHAEVRPHVFPLVVLCDDAPFARRLIDFAERDYDCPSFWFATGCEVLAERRDGTAMPDGEALLDAALAALRRLEAHPLVAGGQRADELFKEHHVDALGAGRRAFERPWRVEGHIRDLCIVVPSTYQLEGGTSVTLNAGIVNDVLRHVVVKLTATPDGAPSEAAGCTLLEGEGWWYSRHARRWVDEPVRAAHIHLCIEERQAQSLVRYLRFAWLQDTIFCTLDGKVVDEGLFSGHGE